MFQARRGQRSSGPSYTCQYSTVVGGCTRPSSQFHRAKAGVDVVDDRTHVRAVVTHRRGRRPVFESEPDHGRAGAGSGAVSLGVYPEPKGESPAELGGCNRSLPDQLRRLSRPPRPRCDSAVRRLLEATPSAPGETGALVVDTRTGPRWSHARHGRSVLRRHVSVLSVTRRWLWTAGVRTSHTQGMSGRNNIARVRPSGRSTCQSARPVRIRARPPPTGSASPTRSNGSTRRYRGAAVPPSAPTARGRARAYSVG